jgi:GTPase KRas protein
MEESYRKLLQIDGNSYMVEIIHLVGMNTSAPMRELCIREGDGFLLVYSVCSRTSFQAASKLHAQILQTKEQSANSSSVQTPIMLVGNQIDREAERQVSTKDGQALAAALQCAFMETSAKSGNNVEKAFVEVVERLIRQRSTQASEEVTSLPRQRSGRQRSSLLDTLFPWRSSRK